MWYRTIILWACICLSVTVTADTYRAIPLKHRDALTIQLLLNEFVGEQVGVSAEGATLLLRGPQNDIKQLVAIVSRLDKPRLSLKVSIYRGAQPLTVEGGSTHSSTNNQLNFFETIVVDEGATVVLRQNQLHSIPIQEYRWQEHAKADDPQKAGSVIAGQYQQHWLVDQSYGITLIPSVLGNGEISIIATFSYPITKPDSGQEKGILTETSTTRTLPLGQWVPLSQHQRDQNRGNLTQQYQHHSTLKQDESNIHFWIKFEKDN